LDFEGGLSFVSFNLICKQLKIYLTNFYYFILVSLMNIIKIAVLLYVSIHPIFALKPFLSTHSFSKLDDDFITESFIAFI
jgi:hypothetical protein